MPGSANLPRSGGAIKPHAVPALIQALLEWRREVELVAEGRVIGTLSIGLFGHPPADVMMDGWVVGRITQDDMPVGWAGGSGDGLAGQISAVAAAAEAARGIATRDETGPPIPGFCSQPEFNVPDPVPRPGIDPEEPLRQGMAAVGTMLQEVATGFRDQFSTLSAFFAKAMPPNPLRRRPDEDDEAFQHRLFDRLSDIGARAKQDPDAAYSQRLQLRAAIESDPDFAAKLGAYLQHIDPEFYADPHAYLKHHNLPPDALKEIPRAETGEIAAPEGEDRIGFFIRNNGNLFEKIAADGKVYDVGGTYRNEIVDWLFGKPGLKLEKAPPPLYAVYAHNNQALQQYEASKAGAAAGVVNAYVTAGGPESGQGLAAIAATLARPFRFSRPSAPVPRQGQGVVSEQNETSKLTPGGPPDPVAGSAPPSQQEIAPASAHVDPKEALDAASSSRELVERESRPKNTTRMGIARTNSADWRDVRDVWDQTGYGDILSDANRAAIARGVAPKVDDAWVAAFPEDAGLIGETISMHHIGGYPITVPLPKTRHLGAHMPGGYRYNPGGAGSAAPYYPSKPGS
jgi:HNH/Endo VII superfamily nuclease toxin with a HHH motif